MMKRFKSLNPAGLLGVAYHILLKSLRCALLNINYIKRTRSTTKTKYNDKAVVILRFRTRTKLFFCRVSGYCSGVLVAMVMRISERKQPPRKIIIICLLRGIRKHMHYSRRKPNGKITSRQTVKREIDTERKIRQNHNNIVSYWGNTAMALVLYWCYDVNNLPSND